MATEDLQGLFNNAISPLNMLAQGNLAIAQQNRKRQQDLEDQARKERFEMGMEKMRQAAITERELAYQKAQQDFLSKQGEIAVRRDLERQIRLTGGEVPANASLNELGQLLHSATISENQRLKRDEINRKAMDLGIQDPTLMPEENLRKMVTDAEVAKKFEDLKAGAKAHVAGVDEAYQEKATKYAKQLQADVDNMEDDWARHAAEFTQTIEKVRPDDPEALQQVANQLLSDPDAKVQEILANMTPAQRQLMLGKKDPQTGQWIQKPDFWSAVGQIEQQRGGKEARQKLVSRFAAIAAKSFAERKQAAEASAFDTLRRRNESLEKREVQLNAKWGPALLGVTPTMYKNTQNMQRVLKDASAPRDSQGNPMPLPPQGGGAAPGTPGYDVSVPGMTEQSIVPTTAAGQDAAMRIRTGQAPTAGALQQAAAASATNPALPPGSVLLSAPTGPEQGTWDLFKQEIGRPVLSGLKAGAAAIGQGMQGGFGPSGYGMSALAPQDRLGMAKAKLADIQAANPGRRFRLQVTPSPNGDIYSYVEDTTSQATLAPETPSAQPFDYAVDPNALFSSP